MWIGSPPTGHIDSYARDAIRALQNRVRDLENQVAELQGKPAGETVARDAERDKALYGGAA